MTIRAASVTPYSIEYIGFGEALTASGLAAASWLPIGTERVRYGVSDGLCFVRRCRRIRGVLYRLQLYVSAAEPDRVG